MAKCSQVTAPDGINGNRIGAVALNAEMTPNTSLEADMRGHHTFIARMGLFLALATAWSASRDSAHRTGGRYFVFDPAGGRGFIAEASSGESCRPLTVPAPVASPRCSPCGSSRARCSDATGTSPRSCGARTGVCVCFTLGHTTLQSSDGLTVADDGPVRGRAETPGGTLSTRELRPPIPPPRTA